MAVLAAQDWHLPARDPTMDLSSSNHLNSSSIPRQRSSPANDHPSSTTAQQLQQQQQQQPGHQLQQPVYSLPLQQQPQGSWTPSITAQPFYPSFYQNPLQQQQYPLHSPQNPIPQQNPYFDPAANAQLAQWAYQQMMFNAQQAHQLHMSPLGPNQRPAEFFPQNQLPPNFNPFPSGTPPPHPNHHPNQFPAAQRNIPDQSGGPQYNGFHPYRRPNRQQSRPSDNEWRGPPGHQGPPQPPYTRTEGTGSTSSVNSVSSEQATPRSRTNSNQSAHSANGHPPPNRNHPNGAPTGNPRSRANPPPPLSTSTNGRSASSSSAGPSSATTPTSRHHRNQSSSSSTSSASVRPSPAATSTTAATASGIAVARPSRPSPLSQGNFTAAEKRISRDDSDLAAMRDPAPTASMLRSGGLKGRLRRALAFNAAQALEEAENEDDKPTPPSSSASKSFGQSSVASSSKPSGTDDTTDGESASAAPPAKKKSRAASLFNARMNVSTDNISLSSTVSSASVMIRKLGSMGKLARRNSLAGITSLFKDKKGAGEAGAEGKKSKKAGKAEASQASVSHVTAELDRSSSSGDWNVGNEMNGLSPAAKLARQHTLKSNAEAAAKAKAQQEAAAAAAAAAAATAATASTSTAGQKQQQLQNGMPGSRAEVNHGARMYHDDGDSHSDGSSEGLHAHLDDEHGGDPYDAEEDWGEEDEDMTIRLGLERTTVHDEEGEEEVVQWAVNIRRSVERSRKPAKGILKNAGTYDQHAFLGELNAPLMRARSNSYNSPAQTSELGPLARIPSPDPDHIDGLHRHPSHSSNHSHPHSSAPTLPPLTFDSSSVMLDSPISSPHHLPELNNSLQPHPPAKPFFNLPNSSAPVLSTIASSNPPTLTHRSATAPAKRLVFASNLSVYDTFSPSVYDRRSEPATWSRLTPALAQRIKEELNSYKMEEMEVHAASRIHTQFFV